MIKKEPFLRVFRKQCANTVASGNSPKQGVGLEEQCLIIPILTKEIGFVVSNFT